MSAGSATLMVVTARTVATVPTIVAATTAFRRCETGGMGLERLGLRPGASVALSGRRGCGDLERAPAERKRDVGELLPDIALADAFGERIDTRQAHEKRGEHARIHAAGGALHRGLPLAPGTGIADRCRDRCPG